MERPVNKEKQANRLARQTNQSITRQVNQLHIFEKNIASANQQWNQILVLNRNNYLAASCSGEPFLLQATSQWAAYADRMDLAIKFLDDLPTGLSQSFRETRVSIEGNIAKNPLAIPVNGTSLDDVSAMPLPLSSQDIQRIDSMIKDKNKILIPLVRANQQPDLTTFYIQSVIKLTATQAEMQPKFPLTDQARPLLARLKDYW